MDDIQSHVMLVDWGFATEEDVTCPFAGTLTYASQRVLASGSLYAFNYTRHDDLHSLANVYHSSQDPELQTLLKTANKDPKKLVDVWTAKCTGYWLDISCACDAANYKQLKNLFALSYDPDCVVESGPESNDFQADS